MSALLSLASAGAASNGLVMVVYIVVIFGAMYFLMIRPQRKEQKQKAAILASMAIGDSVKTSSGMIGTVIDLNEEDGTVIVEFGNNKNCRIPMVKEAIIEVEKPEDALKVQETVEKKKVAVKKAAPSGVLYK